MKIKTSYVCNECGYKSAKWLGKCPECGNWNTFEEYETEIKKTSSKKTVSKRKTATRLSDVKVNNSDRIITKINEFNRITGGGIVRDSVMIITSPPGGGKSTLTLTIANDIATQGMKVVYATGEESESQIRSRADRILDSINENVWIISDTNMNSVIDAVNTIEPDFLVIDSIQTFALEELLPARVGNPAQTMECAAEVVRIAKSGKKPCASIIIGQMNKNDEIAGLRSLEHLVDAVFVMEGDSENELRSITATKNRFGSTGEMGFFSMTEKGLVSIDNPSEFFVTQRDPKDAVSGSAITVIREGSRPIIAEIESLVSNSFTPYPSRIGEAIKREQLNTVISILEQRGGIDLFNKNVVIKATGGIKFKEPFVNLAIIVSIASSVYKKPVPSNFAFIADVGLTGELKKVPNLETRIKELYRMGFDKIFIAKGNIKKNDFKNIEIVELKNLKDVLTLLFK
ncbi:DNA repair protein RadA [Tyzzerella sp. An114]|uniref:DNA repair protein RadA n=1 Tax=Tyzzerella sp. An114 TaxID=1965545 RepID=UPI000B44C443|nr:DNA repair protein RadA [Tyzzerella sp. An114]OUQ59663.1 DNA repair protein RadA [Tyzzerella sp. An114]